MALVYARERASFGGLDSERVKNQARVMQGIINKVSSPEIISNYSSLMNAINGSFVTNISNNQIMSLIRMQLNDMRGWKMETYSLNGFNSSNYTYSYYGSRLYVMEPDYETVMVAHDKILEVINQ